jgi:hypothetical protein
MELVETTISEHIFNQGKVEGTIGGIIRGKAEGMIEGELKGQIAILESLYQQEILSEEQMKYMTEPLRQKLNELMEIQRPDRTIH